MDLLSRSFIFSPTEKNKKFTNVLTRNISEIVALKLVMSGQKKPPKYCCRHCGIYGNPQKILVSLLGDSFTDVGYHICQVERLLGCINRCHCVF